MFSYARKYSAEYEEHQINNNARLQKSLTKGGGDACSTLMPDITNEQWTDAAKHLQQ